MDQDEHLSDNQQVQRQARNLYVSHFLSTWNVRTYEFSSILFTASAYPHTLTAASIRGIITTLASLFLSPLIGIWIDRTPSRLKALIGTISANRSAIIVACLCWLQTIDTLDQSNHRRHQISRETTHPVEEFNPMKHAVFAAILLIGVIEKLSGSANMISMERDWIPTIASRPFHGGADTHAEVPDPVLLTHLNVVMRRIDLLCKLFSPIVISLVITFSGSVRIGIFAVCTMSLTSWVLEWQCAMKVWRENPLLRQPKAHTTQDGAQNQSRPVSSFGAQIRNWVHIYRCNISQYFGADVWMPSIALSMLHFSVLSYSAPLITHFLNIGVPLSLISVVRAASSVVEVSRTAIMPWGVRVLSLRHRNTVDLEEHHNPEEIRLLLPECPDGHQSRNAGTAGLVRVGLWGIWEQFICLIPVVLALWNVSIPDIGFMASLRALFPLAWLDGNSTQMFTIFFFLSLSRLGLWTYDLSAQQLSQTRVPPNQRASFAGTEYSFVAMFDLLGYIAVAALSSPGCFRWLALGSLAVVGASTAMYTFWLRRERGHLIHLEKIIIKVTFRR